MPGGIGDHRSVPTMQISTLKRRLRRVEQRFANGRLYYPTP